MLPAGWRQDAWARVRRVISTDGRTLNWAVLLAAPGLLLWGLWYGLENARPPWMLFLVGALVTVVSFTAARFSAALTRSVLVLGVVVVVIGLVHVGRDAITADRANEARLRATELRVRLDAATPKDKPAPGFDQEAVRKALDEFNTLLDAAPGSPTARALRPVVEELRRLTPEGTEARLGELQILVDALDDEDLRTRAAAAIALVKQPPRASPPPQRPSSTEADDAIMALCGAGGGGLEGTPVRCKKNAGGKVSLDELDDHEAKADLEVARYELALAETDEAKERLGAAVETARTAYATALRSEGDTELAAVDALREGGGEVMGSLDGLGDDEGPRVFGIELGVVGWLLLGGLALLWYRAVERRTAARALGPVTVEGDDAHREQFRTYLHRNVPDPGAVPGATALLPITDLLAVTKATAGDALSKVIAAVVAVLDQKRGYKVTFESVSPNGANTDGNAQESAGNDDKAKVDDSQEKEKAESVVSVRVSHARTDALIDQRLVRDANPSEAIRKAAYWAATVVIDRSDRVPHWAQWPSGTSNSLATYRAREDKGAEEALDAIVRAVSGAPRSGVLCLQLSHAYALGGRHLDAFELALRAAAVDGHYLAARYRLAVTASLVASDVDTNWRTQAVEQRARMVEALRRYSHSPGGRTPKALRKALGKSLGEGNDDAVRKALCDFALAEFKAIDGLLALPRLLNNSLRRSERGYWLAFLRRGEGGVSARVQFLRAIDSARPAIMHRGISSADRKKAAEVAEAKEKLKAAEKGAEQKQKAAKNDPNDQPKADAAVQARQKVEKARAEADAALLAEASIKALAKAAGALEKLLANRSTFWQVAYNVACYDAIRYGAGGGAEVAAEAVEHLESALERPTSHQLKRSWVEKDPDLNSLRHLSRFQAFSTLLYDDREIDVDS